MDFILALGNFKKFAPRIPPYLSYTQSSTESPQNIPQANSEKSCIDMSELITRESTEHIAQRYAENQDQNPTADAECLV